MRLKSRIALISGASSGIGAELARQLAREGAAVGLLARREALIVDLAEKIRSEGGKAAAVKCDVGIRGEVDHAFAVIRGELGSIDLVIANAAVGAETPARSLDAGLVESIFRTNFLGSVNLIAAALPPMLAAGSGQIVGISSLAGCCGMPYVARTPRQKPP